MSSLTLSRGGWFRSAWFCRTRPWENGWWWNARFGIRSCFWRFCLWKVRIVQIIVSIDFSRSRSIRSLLMVLKGSKFKSELRKKSQKIDKNILGKTMPMVGVPKLWSVFASFSSFSLLRVPTQPDWEFQLLVPVLLHFQQLLTDSSKLWSGIMASGLRLWDRAFQNIEMFPSTMLKLAWFIRWVPSESFALISLYKALID